jgi:SAM-dependent methyltransferase
MQEIADENAYDVICSLSWVIHYCETERELNDVFRCCRRALREGGLLLLQVANDEQMTGAVNVDREPGPSGEPDDTFFIHRFHPLHDVEHCVIADYIYISRTYNDLLSEQHQLRFASPPVIARAERQSGFLDVAVINSASLSSFVVGTAA